MAPAAQLISGRKSGRSAADDRDLFAGRGAGFELVAVLERGISDVHFHRIDADIVIDFVAVAAILAGRRTDAAHHRRERIGVGGAAESIFLPGDAFRGLFLLTHDRQPATNVLTRRTAALARRRLVDVGWAFVRSIFIEDLVGEAVPRVVAVFKTTPGELGVHFFARSGHRLISFPVKLIRLRCQVRRDQNAR